MLNENTKLKMDMGFEEAVNRFSRVNTKDVLIEENKIPSPFVKWVGGKRSIIQQLVCRLPKEFNDYYEPMVGGGALFYEISDRIHKAVLSDINLKLVLTYQVVKEDPDKLIAKLKEHEKNHCEEYYYKIRKQHDLKDPVEIAARFIYLNKTCYNGLYRVNKSGEFNVPMGTYKNPTINQEKNIMACSKVLQRAKILYGGFDQITPTTGDFVYFDPPYHPTSDISFTSYNKEGFSEKDQERLRDFYVSLGKRGVYCMLSNSNTPFIRELYKKYKIDIVEAPRMVNCKSNKRNNVEELVIINYE